MSEELRVVAVDVLTPLVGKAMATVYVAKAALRHGKSSDELEANDAGWLCDEIRLEISPFATKSLVDSAMAEIHGRVRR